MPAQSLKRKPKTQSTAAVARSAGAARSSAPPVAKSGAILNSRKTVQATQAKNRFGEILKRVREAGPVFIERHGRPQAVLLDFATYQGLVARNRTTDEKQLDALRAQFDELYARMQKPAARAVADRFLAASAEALNKVARRARTRG